MTGRPRNPSGHRRAHTRNGRPVRGTSIKARKAQRKRQRKAKRRRVSRQIRRKVSRGLTQNHKVVHRGKLTKGNRRRPKPALFMASGAFGGGALLALANGRIFYAGLLGGVALGALGLHFGVAAYQKRRR